MNLSREIAKLKRNDQTGRVMTVNELEALRSLLQSARDGIMNRHGCGQALTILNAIVGEENDR